MNPASEPLNPHAQPKDDIAMHDNSAPEINIKEESFGEREGIRSKLSAGSNLATVVELCKRRGFVFPSSEIYGGFASAYDYGPLGTLMINNIKEVWTKEIVRKNPNIISMDSSIVGHPRIWEASGHTEAFNDPLVTDSKTGIRYRADKLIEDALGISTSNLSFGQMQELISKNQIKSPAGNDLNPLKTFNLMVEANLGTAHDEKQKVYLRGETCQGIFVNFNNLVNSSRQTVPFGVFQIGKAFRNEITARQFVIRTREFEQMEFEYFFNPGDKTDWYNVWSENFLSLLNEKMGLPRDRLRLRVLPPEEMSHYAKKQADIEFLMPNGDWLELSPMNHRGDWDLSRHASFSGTKMEYRDAVSGEKFVPNVIETSFGVGRLFYTLIDYGLAEEQVPGEGEPRKVLRLAPRIAPYQCAVFPLFKKAGMPEIAHKIYGELAEHMNVDFDAAGSIGRRYRRQDEIGTPYCVTVDFDSASSNSVTVRDRDSMQQEKVNLNDLVEYLRKKVK